MDPIDLGRVVSRRAARCARVAVVAAYVALAALSGHLSPLARGPLLDGIGPPQAYRWVSPPPDLASTNVAPSSLTRTLPLAPNGQSRRVPRDLGQPDHRGRCPTGAIAPHGARHRACRIDITPVDPAHARPARRRPRGVRQRLPDHGHLPAVGRRAVTPSARPDRRGPGVSGHRRPCTPPATSLYASRDGDRVEAASKTHDILAAATGRGADPGARLRGGGRGARRPRPDSPCATGGGAGPTPSRSR